MMQNVGRKLMFWRKKHKRLDDKNEVQRVFDEVTEITKTDYYT